MSSEGHVGRRKSRQACEPCRQSKRKCDGQKPCYSCRRYEHACSYSSRAHRRGRIQNENSSEEQISSATSIVQDDDATTTTPNIVETQYAKHTNTIVPVPSGNTFAQGLLAELSNGETQPEYSSWNIGLRVGSEYEKLVSQMATLEEATHYSQVYFDKVNPVYSIVNQAHFMEKLQDRWHSPSSNFDEYDAIICGVIVLGSLFSGANSFHRETVILEMGQTILGKWIPVDRTSRSSLTIATAWILRVLYLRMAADPRAAWQASRSAIHAVEGYDSEDTRKENDSLCTNNNEASVADTAHVHSKLHWITRLLDTWIRNEFHPWQYDRVMVIISCPPPTQSTSDNQDFTSTLISLFVISLRFVNSREQKSLTELSQILKDIDALSMSGHDALQLHKSNHALCIYRFMRCTPSVIPRATLLRILGIARPGLAAALRLVKDNQPWWHVLHLPFQLLCVSLSMDTTESLALVNDCMNTLRDVQQQFPTKSVHNILRTAEYLVRMCQRKKLEAAETLSRSTHGILCSRKHSSTAGETSLRESVPSTSPADSLAVVQSSEGNAVNALGEMDPEGFDLLDWEKFLCPDFAFDFGLSDTHNVSHTE